MTFPRPHHLSALPGRTVRSGAPDPEDDLKLGDVWAALIRNRWIILGCALLGLGLGRLYTSRETPWFESWATIRIQERQLNLSEVYSTVGGGVAGSDLGTEMEVLKSRALLEDAAAALGLQVILITPERLSRQLALRDITVAKDAPEASYRLLRRPDGRFVVFAGDEPQQVAVSGVDGRVQVPGAAFTLTPVAQEREELEIAVQSFNGAVSMVSGGLWVTQPRRDAYIVTLGYSTPDSLLARDVPNALVTSYLARRQVIRSADAKNTVQFLQEQLTRVTAELAAAEDSFRTYQERTRTLNPQVETGSEISRLVTKESERSSVEAERQALAASLAEIEAAPRASGSSPYRKLVGLPFLLRNPAASALLSSLITAENDRAALVGRTALDPDVEVLTARINDLEKQLHSITTTYLNGLGNQVRSMSNALDQYQRELDAIPRKQLFYARLERRVTSLEEVNALLSSKLKEAEIAEAARDASVQVVDMATEPTEPSGPDATVNGLIALVLGLLAGLGIAAVREFRDKSVHTRKDILIATGVPVLGLIPRIPRANGRIAMITEKLKLAASSEAARKSRPPRRPQTGGYTFLTEGSAGSEPPVSEPVTHETAVSNVGGALPIQLRLSSWGAGVAEAYGLLQTNIAFAHAGRSIKVVVITSPLAEDGKTTCATNLALTLAMRGNRTLLVDADLRRGVVHVAFDTPRGPGLAEVLAGSASFGEAVRSVRVGPENSQLYFLPTGAPPANPSGLLESGFANMLEGIREHFDSIIIDSPPANIISDASVLGLQADGVLVVARSGVTQASALASATEQLQRVGVPMLGVVLNDIDFKRESGYDSTYRAYTDSAYVSTSGSSSG